MSNLSSNKRKPHLHTKPEADIYAQPAAAAAYPAVNEAAVQGSVRHAADVWVRRGLTYSQELLYRAAA